MRGAREARMRILPSGARSRAEAASRRQAPARPEPRRPFHTQTHNLERTSTTKTKSTRKVKRTIEVSSSVACQAANSGLSLEPQAEAAALSRRRAKEPFGARPRSCRSVPARKSRRRQDNWQARFGQRPTSLARQIIDSDARPFITVAGAAEEPRSWGTFREALQGL